MNMLIDLLPETVNLRGREVPINSDFRASILFELMMQDEEVPNDQKLLRAIELYYQTPIPYQLYPEAIDGVLWFYSMGDCKSGESARRSTDSEDEGDDHKRVYSFEHDDRYIYSAFLSQYRIDLADIEYLHWWKFRAMFLSLGSDCQFSKIMEYRGVKITNDMSKEQRAFYKRMKRLYALPLPQSEQERMDAITQALLNGGDLSGILGGAHE